MNHLYILGNGFDIHHDLKTRYTNFAIFLKEHDWELYERFLENFGLTDLEVNDPDHLYDPLWSRFEEHLADLDYQVILDENDHLVANPMSEDFRDSNWDDYAVEMEVFVDDLTANITRAFKQFIRAVEYPENIDDKRLFIDQGSAFLCFNYTKTLQHYYQVPSANILFIHGSADQDDKLILGHGVSPDAFVPPVPQPPSGLSEQELWEWNREMADNWEYSTQRALDSILEYFRKMHKNTHRMIQQNASFFKRLASLEKITVIGHSLGEVDHDYFKKIIEINNGLARWLISFYTDHEASIFGQILTDLGVHQDKIHFFRTTDLLV